MHTTETYVPDELVAGNAGLLLATPITLAAGAALRRGAVLARLESGQYALCAANDGGSPPTPLTAGSVPDLILVEDTAASAGERPALGYLRGDFQAAQVTLGPGHSVASVRETLRSKGIFLV